MTERQREAEAAARAAGDELAPLVAARAWQAQVRLNHRHRVLTRDRGKRATVTNVAVARELVGFLWAAMTDQPVREELAACPNFFARRPREPWRGWAAGEAVREPSTQAMRPPGLALGPDELPWTARRGFADDRDQAALTRTRRRACLASGSRERPHSARPRASRHPLALRARGRSSLQG